MTNEISKVDENDDQTPWGRRRLTWAGAFLIGLAPMAAFPVKVWG